MLLAESGQRQLHLPGHVQGRQHRLQQHAMPHLTCGGGQHLPDQDLLLRLPVHPQPQQPAVHVADIQHRCSDVWRCVRHGVNRLQQYGLRSQRHQSGLRPFLFLRLLLIFCLWVRAQVYLARDQRQKVQVRGQVRGWGGQLHQQRHLLVYPHGCCYLRCSGAARARLVCAVRQVQRLCQRCLLRWAQVHLEYGLHWEASVPRHVPRGFLLLLKLPVCQYGKLPAADLLFCCCYYHQCCCHACL
mmetsp:Transcript_42810/g.83913  ORF Transcript_42810/g.83913 Transcript_42810/m.83913 type:complete len:243 (+) Transcript_42810:3600-4328(+)